MADDATELDERALWVPSWDEEANQISGDLVVWIRRSLLLGEVERGTTSIVSGRRVGTGPQ